MREGGLTFRARHDCGVFLASWIDDLPRTKVWVETMTGLEGDSKGNIEALETEVWQERGERLRRLGGPPRDGFRVAFGPDSLRC